MPRILVETFIAAPIEAVFDSARSLQGHAASAAWTGERVIAPTDHDLVVENDVVMFEAVHFGIGQRLTARVAALTYPTHFRNELIRAAFKTMIHDHFFERVPGGSRMVDDLIIEAPLGALGRVADRLFLTAYMRRFVARTADSLKQSIEAEVSGPK